MSFGKVRLTIATHNPHKTREFAMLLGDDFQVGDLSLVPNMLPVEETGATFEENAELKARAASGHFRGMIVADDSGLEVDALDGAPGVYSARYAGALASDRENVEKLLCELQKLGAWNSKVTARFHCVLAVVVDAKLCGTFHGAIEGEIVHPPRGRNGFGYDPVFLPDGWQKTFGELPPETKNAMSHRAAAVAAMRAALIVLLAGEGEAPAERSFTGG